MDLDSKLDEMRGMLHEMKPVLAAQSESLKSIDLRLRYQEIKSNGHEIKMERAITDLDLLGRKVREKDNRERVRSASESQSSKWIAFLELLAVLPKYGHVIISLGSVVVAAAVIIAKLSGHTVTHP